jgi:hypothetical protein
VRYNGKKERWLRDENMKETFHKRFKTRVLRLFHCLTRSVQENSDAANELCRECFTAHPSRIAVIVLHPKVYHFIIKLRS